MDDGEGARTGGAGLEGWLAELRVDAAARRRRQGAWLRRRDEAGATLAGVLVDLAERGAPVVVDTVAGRRHRGRVVGVGTDLCVLRTATGVDVLVRSAAVVAVRPGPGEPEALGSDRAGGATTFVEAVAALAGTGARVVALGPGGGEPVRGELGAVGADVAEVRLDGGGGIAYVALGALAEVSVAESG